MNIHIQVDNEVWKVFGNKTFVRANVAQFKKGDEVPLGQFPAIWPDQSDDYDTATGSGSGSGAAEPETTFGCGAAEIAALALPAHLVTNNSLRQC